MNNITPSLRIKRVLNNIFYITSPDVQYINLLVDIKPTLVLTACTRGIFVIALTPYANKFFLHI